MPNLATVSVLQTATETGVGNGGDKKRVWVFSHTPQFPTLFPTASRHGWGGRLSYKEACSPLDGGRL